MFLFSLIYLLFEEIFSFLFLYPL